MDVRQRLTRLNDRVQAVALSALLAGTTLAFGGHVWWGPPWLAALSAVLVVGCLARMLLEGRVRFLRSPLSALGGFALVIALAQVVPLPPAVAQRLSPASRAAYAVGFLPDRARTLDPEVEIPEAPVSRTPVSLDRPATVRWAAGAAVCLAVFWAASQYADRLGHLYVVWGSVVAAFFVNVSLAVVQIACRAGGLFGLIEPGRGPFWSPNLNDVLSAPGTRLLRLAADAQPGHPVWALSVPDRPFSIGSLVGGPGALLALGSLGLPLALAITLQLLAPRGSRESLSTRLGHSGQVGLVWLLVVMTAAAAAVLGLLAGTTYCGPFVLGLLVAGLPCSRGTGLRWSAVGLTLLPVGVLVAGAVLGEAWAETRGPLPSPVPPVSFAAASRVWSDSLPIARDFPLLGTGLGTFASVYPFYKTQDGSSTTAMSSLLQWWVESGLVGVVLLGVAGAWAAWKLPGAVRRVGTADRALAYGLVGAGLTFSVFSALHWSVELVAVALAASAVLGTCNRWLAGGTDLFVERA